MTPKTPPPETLADETPVATGDRREEVHYEPDPDQLLRMRATEKPDHRPPFEGATHRAPDEEAADAPPIEDVRVAPPGPSVWDARPADDAAGSDPSDATRAR